MSDNNRTSIENRGWGQMAAVLEKEMPQKKRKRIPLFWFFVISLILLSFALLMNDSELEMDSGNEGLTAQLSNITLKSKNRESENSFLKTESKTNLGQDLKSKLDQNRLSQIPQKQYDSEVSNVDKMQLLNNLHKEHRMEVIDNKVIINQDVTTRSSLVNSKLIEPKSQSILTRIINPESNLQEKIRSDHVKIGEITRRYGTRIIRKQLVYENMPIRESALRSKQEFLPAFYLSKSKKNSESPIINTRETNNNYVFVGGLVGLNTRGIGYELGLGRKFGDNGINFFIETGYSYMNYYQENPDSKIVNVEFIPEEIELNTEFSMEDKAQVQKALIDNQNGNDLISNLSRVFVTIGFNKEVSHRFSILGGVTFSRYLSIENQELNFISNNGLFQENLNQYNVSRSMLFDNGQFSKFEWSTRFGIDYQVTPRLSLIANCNIGLTNISKTDSFRLDNSSSFPLEDLIQDENPINIKNTELRINYRF